MAWVRPKLQPEAPRAAGYGCGPKMLRLVHTSKMTGCQSLVAAGAEAEWNTARTTPENNRVGERRVWAVCMFNFKGERD